MQFHMIRCWGTRLMAPLLSWMLALPACDDAGSTPTEDVGADVTPAPNACENAGGFCAGAFRSSSPPGFAVSCGPDHVTADGESDWLGPGSSLMPGTLMNGGCGQGVTEGGEASFRACCYPAAENP
jgi:hypothetical protein